MSHCTEGYLKRKPTAKDGLRVGLPGRVGSIHGEQDGLADQLATISIDIYHYQYIYIYIYMPGSGLPHSICITVFQLFASRNYIDKA